MRQASAGTLAFVILVAASQLSTATIKPREVKKHPPGTEVTYTTYNSGGKVKPIVVPQKAADRIILLANQIKMRTRPMGARRFQPAPVGSFTIGKGTWLHLHKVGRLEDPSYQGVHDSALKHLAESLLQRDIKLDGDIFLRWLKELDELDANESRKSK